MNRRGFLQTCLALCAAPAIVRADSLMRVYARPGLSVTFGVLGRIIHSSGVCREFTHIDVTSILDIAKTFVVSDCRYTVPEITLALPPGRIIRAWADEREADISFEQTADGVKIRDLELAQYGNRIPSFSFDMEGV